MLKKCGKFMADWRDSSPVAQTPATYGSQRQNQFYGPGYFNTDFTIMKNTAIPGWERGELGLGVQFFNLFNYPNFDQPNRYINDPSLFGQIGGSLAFALPMENPPFGDTEPGMSPQSQSPASDVSSHQSGHPFPVGGEIEPLVGADTAAEFLQVSPRRIFELARRGALPGYPLGNGPATCGDSASQNLPASARRQGTMRAAVSRAQRRNPKWHGDINVVG